MENFCALNLIKWRLAIRSKGTDGHSRRESKVWSFKMMAVSFCVMVIVWVRSAKASKWLKYFQLEHSQPNRHSSHNINPNCCQQKSIHRAIKCRPQTISSSHNSKPIQHHPKNRWWWRSDHCICSPNKSIRHNVFHVHDAVETIHSEKICDDTFGWSADKSHAFHVLCAIYVSNETIKWTAIWSHDTVSKMDPPMLAPSST